VVEEDLLSEDSFLCVVPLLDDFLLAVKVEKSVYPQSDELAAPRSELFLRRMSGDTDCRPLSGDMDTFLDLDGDTDTDSLVTDFLGTVDGLL